jgi:myo-inositol-1(or 4)-monophosphatase
VTGEELERTLAIARDAAHAAALHVHGGYRQRLVVEHKGVVDLVTSFDRESETMLRERLAPCGHGVVGEEQGGEMGDVGFFIDPIDGTTNFVHGHPFWCVSIGLIEARRPVLGVVVAPALGLEWYGYTAEGGARVAVRQAIGGDERAGITCRVSSTAAFEDSLLATGFPYDRKESADNNFDAFVAIKQRCQAVRRCGSAALDLCLVADGTYEGYWEKKLNAWDIAGGAAVVDAAGGQVTDYAGTPDFMDSGNVVASNGIIHGELIDQLARVYSSRG